MTSLIADPSHIERYRIASIRSAIKLYHNAGILINRRMTITKLLKQASEVTGKTYKRGQGR